jgi:hypothetical protein
MASSMNLISLAIFWLFKQFKELIQLRKNNNSRPAITGFAFWGVITGYRFILAATGRGHLCGV